MTFAKEDPQVRARLRRGIQLTELELVHPHALEPMRLQLANGGYYQLVAFPEVADQVAVEHLGRWLNGQIHTPSSTSSPWKQIADETVASSLPPEVLNAFETIRAWNAGGARVRVTAIVGADGTELLKISTD